MRCLKRILILFLCLTLMPSVTGCSASTERDTLAPSAPTELSRTTPCNDNTPTFAWNAAIDDESGVDYYLVAADAGEWLNAGYASTYTLNTALLDGNHTFSVKAVDKAGNEGDEDSCTFTCDTTSPSISSISATGITASSFVITWSTDESATSQVEYGGNASYGLSSTFDSTYKTSHSVILTGLTSAVTYHYRVKSTDSCGNEAVSVDYPFTTPALVFSEDFDTFDSGQWVAATYLPWYTGMPETILPTVVDGKSVIFMRTIDTGSHRRRGISSTDSIPLPSDQTTVVEMAFEPLGDLDGVAELWLYDPSTSRYAEMTLYAGNLGADKTVSAEISGYGSRSSGTPVFSWNEWLIFRIECNPTSTLLSLLDSNRNVRWTTTYDVALSNLFQSFSIAISQGIEMNGSGPWTMKSNIEYVKVTRE